MRPSDATARTLRNKTWVGAAILALVVAGFPAMLSAADGGSASSESSPSKGAERGPGEVSNVVEELSQKIYSPYCPGKTLAMCPSGGAAEVRRNIQEMAEQGVSRDEIRNRVIEEHGEEYRLKEPPTEDNYPLAAIIAVALLVCIVAVVLFSRSSDADSESDDGPDPEDLSDEDEIFLEELRSQYRD